MYVMHKIVMITTGAITVIIIKDTLQVLNMSPNTIEDEWKSVMVEQLQHVTTLTKLSIIKCGLSVKGTIVCVKCSYVANLRCAHH